MLADVKDTQVSITTPCGVCGSDKWIFAREGRDLLRPDNCETYTLGQCVVCGHIFQVPRPSAEELRSAYSAEYAPYRPAWKEPGWPLWKILRQITTWRRVKRLTRYGRGKDLLELGSGAGDFLYAVHSAGWNVKAVEYSEALADALREELNLDVRPGELTADLWTCAEFDVAVLWSVLEHVPDPLETLGIVASHLRKGGVCLIQIPTQSGVELGKRFGHFWALLDLPRHLNFFSERSLSQLCEKPGMSLIAFRTPLLDTAWCYLASSWNYASRTKSQPVGLLRFVGLAALVFLALPYLAFRAWRGRGTEAFAVAIKR